MACVGTKETLAATPAVRRPVVNLRRPIFDGRAMLGWREHDVMQKE
jgi:hypothetical protein